MYRTLNGFPISKDWQSSLTWMPDKPVKLQNPKLNLSWPLLKLLFCFTLWHGNILYHPSCRNRLLLLGKASNWLSASTSFSDYMFSPGYLFLSHKQKFHWVFCFYLSLSSLKNGILAYKEWYNIGIVENLRPYGLVKPWIISSPASLHSSAHWLPFHFHTAQYSFLTCSPLHFLLSVCVMAVLGCRPDYIWIN